MDENHFQEGSTNVQTFDACFHPKTIGMCKQHKQFKDMVIKIALENVTQALNLDASEKAFKVRRSACNIGVVASIEWALLIKYNLRGWP